MKQFNVGEKVREKSSGRVGIVHAIHAKGSSEYPTRTIAVKIDAEGKPTIIMFELSELEAV